MPQMDAAAVSAAAPGEIVLTSGVVRSNPPLKTGSTLVAYTELVWEVTVTEVEDDRSVRGAWSTPPPTVAPALTLDVAGAQVPLQAVSLVRLSGDLLREEIVRGPEDVKTATFEGERLPEGSRRYRGLADGDLVTVLGQKAAAGDVLPEQIFAGDRVAFEASQRDSASALLNMGSRLCPDSVEDKLTTLPGARTWYKFVWRSSTRPGKRASLLERITAFCIRRTRSSASRQKWNRCNA